MESPYSSLITAMRAEGAKQNGFDMTLCAVASVQPLAIQYNGVPISRNLYCHPAWLPEPENQLEQILEAEEGLSAAFKSYLIVVQSQFKLAAGDMVVVQRVNNNFFILGKVVQAK